MKLDKRAVDRLAGLPDEKLWDSVRMLTSVMGVQVSDRMNRPEKLKRLRTALAVLTEEDLARLTEILNTYRRGGK